MSPFRTRSGPAGSGPRPRRRWAVAAAATVLALAVAGCGSSKGSATTVSGTGNGPTVGFIMVGSDKDEGYNQAVYTASQQVARDLGVKVITADNVPETNAVTQTMQSMVNQGATTIFATSYGYFSYALAFAQSHPNITVLHQGGFQKGAFPPNFGTYWGEAFEPVALGGMAAGAVTKSHRLGFVYAFPIGQTIDNINAFELGAQLTDPSAQTYIVNTSSWCDPVKQKEAAQALIAQNADVLTQHQDCQGTVIQTAKTAGVHVVGYHYDAHDLDPSGWLTGSAWNWTPTYEAIVKAVINHTFTGGPYNANFVGSFADNNNPLQLASFGPDVTPDTRAKINAELAALKQPGASIFKGPIYCQDGSLLVAPGVVPTYDQIQNFNCLVRGVVGTLPKS